MEPWNHPDFASFLGKERAKVRRKRDKKYKEAGLDPRPLPEPPVSPIIRNAQRPRPLLLTRMDVPPAERLFEEPEPQWSSAERSLMERLRSPPRADSGDEPVLLRRMRPIQERFAVTLNERMNTQERLRDPTPEPDPSGAKFRTVKNARQEARDYARAVAISEVEDVMPANPQANPATDRVAGGSNASMSASLVESSEHTSLETSMADSAEAMDVDADGADVDMDDIWRETRRKAKRRAKDDDHISLDSYNEGDYDEEDFNDDGKA
ncbi:hypothetical protein C8F01DRAFT_1115566 [Mycena amicta]|nr:hypothetical protein C8F01DRAFT_1115566 [Mycena amicta]